MDTTHYIYNAKCTTIMKNADKKAYPQNNTSLTSAPEYGGLTKRERFAMAAMQGLNANSDFTELGHEAIAETAVQTANALLIRLEEETK